MIGGDAALALVCHRNHRMSFVFEAAQAAGVRLVLIHDASENEPPRANRRMDFPGWWAIGDCLFSKIPMLH